ncbi:MAG: hypothetical protein IE886_00845 [Campylobacterales bacterium]|nr:hypothetical protein [Campylobacterales bacterium]
MLLGAAEMTEEMMTEEGWFHGRQVEWNADMNRSEPSRPRRNSGVSTPPAPMRCIRNSTAAGESPLPTFAKHSCSTASETCSCGADG